MSNLPHEHETGNNDLPAQAIEASASNHKKVPINAFIKTNINALILASENFAKILGVPLI
ncbi:MAG: hypothetical protein ACJARI_003862 [Bacteroidia bacterium]|jgi:hypothetical protein